MPDVTFVAPGQRGPELRFLEALSELDDVTLSLVCEGPADPAPPEGLELVEVSDVSDTGLVSHAVEELRRRGRDVTHLLCVDERLELPLAVTRDRLGLPGLHPHAAANFLDPARAADVLRGRGLPVADETRRGLVGIVVGGEIPWHVAYEEVRPPPEVVAAGVRGLERILLLPREDPDGEAGRGLVGEAVRALGLRDGMCHAGLGPGASGIGRVRAWPPEPWILEAIAWGQGVDPWRAWGEALVHGRAPGGAPTHAVGALLVRGPEGDVHALAGEGTDGLETRVLDGEGPAHTTAPAGGGVLLVRHPDADAVREALWKILGRHDSVDA